MTDDKWRVITNEVGLLTYAWRDFKIQQEKVGDYVFWNVLHRDSRIGPASDPIDGMAYCESLAEKLTPE